jgi:hypothetical protein
MRVFLYLLLLTSTVQAGPNPATPNPMEPVHALPPEKLEAIRLIGQNVLQAKKDAPQDTSNKDQLAVLNTVLSNLIAAETPMLSSQPIVTTGSNNTASTSNAQKVNRDAARTSFDRTQATCNARTIHRQKSK